MDFQKHVNQDLLLRWQTPETISRVDTKNVYVGPTMCLPCVRHWGSRRFLLCLCFALGTGHVEMPVMEKRQTLVHSFTCSFYQYLLSIYSLPGTVSGSGILGGSKQLKFLPLWKWSRGTLSINKQYMNIQYVTYHK